MTFNEYNIDSIFYKELLQWWADFRAEFSTKPSISECIIWNNKNIAKPYTLFQNGCHFSILLFTCKLALVASFKGKYSFEFRV